MVSVLLPFYRASETMERAIQSVVRQSFPDWELLLIDNNADELTSQIAHRWQLQEERIRVIREPRQGIAFALDTGLQQAAALVARMDADDVAHPDRLRQQYTYLQSHPEVGVVACQCSFASTLPQAEGYRHFVAWQNSILSPEAHFLNRFIESPVAHPSVMYRKELVENFGGYNTDPGPEDYELWLRWMSQGVQFAKVPEELLLWQDHPARLSRTHVDYATSRFWETKMHYLALWLKQNLPASRKIVVCGASKQIRKRADLLRAKGIKVYGYTDIKSRPVPAGKFIPLDNIKEDKDFFFVNLIARRGVREAIRENLKRLGLQEGVDFIMAG
jgi:glycosyltransferase involved in cell wall biosynthesis